VIKGLCSHIIDWLGCDILNHSYADNFVNRLGAISFGTALHSQEPHYSPTLETLELFFFETGITTVVFPRQMNGVAVARVRQALSASGSFYFFRQKIKWLENFLPDRRRACSMLTLCQFPRVRVRNSRREDSDVEMLLSCLWCDVMRMRDGTDWVLFCI